ncbi:unnamed protein product [Prorocentrum cordatum]|uniref:PE domain-containing protein n=1 Tax=Prorocentrum cordatum TaxID=2364126 RepID=A0ABN9TDP1_9DINO|nr:unnamed protein product [Polarella glacialis]
MMDNAQSQMSAASLEGFQQQAAAVYATMPATSELYVAASSVDASAVGDTLTSFQDPAQAAVAVAGAQASMAASSSAPVFSGGAPSASAPPPEQPDPTQGGGR